jgi:uncharacterized damage-inducible protein DinB
LPIHKEVFSMIKEIEDQLHILQMLHTTIDKALDGLSDEEWVKKPGESFNNIASIIDHVMLVEQKFMSIIAGLPSEIDSQEPFHASSWDVAKIKSKWAKILDDARVLLDNVSEDSLSDPGLNMSAGELNKREVLSYMIAHTAHHRGQLPLLKRMLAK